MAHAVLPQRTISQAAVVSVGCCCVWIANGVDIEVMVAGRVSLIVVVASPGAEAAVSIVVDAFSCRWWEFTGSGVT